MPGSYSDPVILDPFRTIIEVGWPTPSTAADWIFLEIGGYVDPNDKTSTGRVECSPAASPGTYPPGGYWTFFTATWNFRISNVSLYAMNSLGLTVEFEWNARSEGNWGPFGISWDIPPAIITTSGGYAVSNAPIPVIDDVNDENGYRYIHTLEAGGSPVPEADAVWSVTFSNGSGPDSFYSGGSVSLRVCDNAPFTSPVCLADGLGPTPAIGYLGNNSLLTEEVTGFSPESYNAALTLEFDPPETITYAGKTYTKVASHITDRRGTGSNTFIATFAYQWVPPSTASASG